LITVCRIFKVRLICSVRHRNYRQRSQRMIPPIAWVALLQPGEGRIVF